MDNSISLDIEITLNDSELTELAKQITFLDGENDSAENEMEILKSEVSTIKKNIEAKDLERRKMSRDYARGKTFKTYTAYYKDDAEAEKRLYYETGTDMLLKEEPLPKSIEMF